VSLLASSALQGGLKNPLLHGSDVPAKFEGVAARVEKIRIAPTTFKAPFIIDFAEPLPYGCKSWAVNQTSVAVLAEKIGDDLEVLNGKRIYLKCCQAENPQTGEIVRSLCVGKVEGERATPARKVDVKAKKIDAKQQKTLEGINEKDLPF
jgi:hypothetical protein